MHTRHIFKHQQRPAQLHWLHAVRSLAPQLLEANTQLSSVEVNFAACGAMLSYMCCSGTPV